MSYFTHPQFLTRQELVNKRLDYQALNEAWRATLEPFTYISLERLLTKKEANEDILETDNVITITSKDFPPNNFCYKFVDDDDDDVDNDNIISFAQNDRMEEYADRHPTQGAPIIQTDTQNLKRFNSSIHTPITTTASKYLFSVVLAGGDEIVQLKASYRHQLSIRIDKETSCLYLDCFEYKATCLDVLRGGESPMPTEGETNAYGNIIFGNGRGDRDEGATRTVARSGDTHNDIMEHYKALVGKFLNSRVFQLGISLSNVKGIRLIAMPTDHRSSNRQPDSDNDIAAVLILEIAEPEDIFAVRTVRSKRNNADSFTLCPDWLPGNGTGSKTSRFYFYGSLTEMKSTAAHMAKLSIDIANMLEAKGSNTLALSPGIISVEYDAAPSYGSNKKRRVDGADSKNTFTRPLPSAWDGNIINIREVFEASLAREQNPAKRMMLRMMADPLSVIAVNQDPNSSAEDVMLSTMLGQQVAREGMDSVMDMSMNGCAQS